MTVVEQKRKRGRPRLGQDPSTAVSLRLDRASVAKLRVVARARGIGPTLLLRQWVMEHLQDSELGVDSPPSDVRLDRGGAFVEVPRLTTGRRS